MTEHRDLEPLTPRQRRHLDSLYREHASTIRLFILARTRDPELADEITSIVFMEAARAAGREHCEPLSIAWLITVARRRLIDAFRRRSLEARTAFTTATSRQADCADEVLATLLVVDLLRTVQPRQRAALWHRYLADQPLARIAERLDLSESAAESLLRRGRQNLARVVIPADTDRLALT